MEPTEYQFWCCQCKRNEIDDVARISNNNNNNNDNNNNSSMSNGIVVTQQPFSNNENNCSYDDLSFSNTVSEIKSGFNEQKHKLDDDSEMRIEMRRLKEESTNITSILLDNLISEPNKINPAEEVTTNDQEEIKKFPKQQDSIGSVYNMEDIVLSDVDEEDLWEFPTDNKQITRIGDDHKEQVVHHNLDHIANCDKKEEFKETNDVSNVFGNAEHTSELESFQENSNHTKILDIRLNEATFLHNVVRANDSEKNIDTFSKSTNSLISFTNRKLSTNSNERDDLSMICILDDDLVMKKENAQNSNISMETECKNVSVLEHDDTEAIIQSNKMYANDVSSSSSTDREDVPETIISIKNSEKILNISKKSVRTDISTTKYTNAKDDNTTDDDNRLIIKYKNAPKNNDSIKMFTDDILSERLI
ncbi:hypothetical protein ACH3XW_43315 [Acanthocheilonema viteae]